MPGLRSTSDEEDRAEVEVLYARLEKTVYLTKKIQNSLTRLETSGGRVKKAIGPIYGNTQKLQVLGQNIDRVNEAIEKLREPLDIRGKEERIIRAGPEGAGLAEYLGSLQRVSGALSRLKATNLRSNQDAIADFGRLVKTGSQQLESVFHEILREDARPTEPLFYITKKKQFPGLLQEKLSRLGLINSFVASAAARTSSSDGSGTPTAQIYADVRGPYVKSTLQNLAAASVTTSKKKVQDAVYQRESSGINVYVKAMELLFLAEYDNICSVFARDDWGLVFRATCRGAVADLTNTLRDLNSHIRANLMTDCFLAYEIVDVISRLSFSIDGKTGELKNTFSDALKPIRETAKSSLAELLEDVRTRASGMSSIPSDGAVVPVTIETMTRLQSMTSYLAPLSSIMTSLGDGNWTSTSSAAQASSTSLPSLKSFDVGADGRKLLAHYAMDNIEVLMQNLESKGRGQPVTSKAKDNKGNSLLGAFLTNNVAMIERMVRSSDLGPLLVDSMTRIDFWRKKGKTLYSDAWRETSIFLLDAVHTNRGGQRPPSGSSANINSAEVVKALSGKEKDIIKEKFRNFNASFDTLVERHRSLAMEREVRALLGRDVQAMIEPLYCRFWDRYHEIDKGKGKYVKYEKSQLVGLLAGLG